MTVARLEESVGRKRVAVKRTKTERAYEAIKQGILLGEIADGAFLSEGEIVARYGIGRTPYREACNRLHHEGLLQAVPRRGYFVPEISLHSVRDVFEVRVVLESAIAELAAVRATDHEIEELQQLAAKPWRLGRSPGELTEFVESNTAFHLSLAKTTRNRVLVDLLARNLESTNRIMYIELGTAKFRNRDFHKLHVPIVDALRSRDPNRVRGALLADILDAQSTTFSIPGLRDHADTDVGQRVLGQRFASEKLPVAQVDSATAHSAVGKRLSSRRLGDTSLASKAPTPHDT